MSQTVKAVQLSQFGSPEALKFVEVSVGEPGPGEARVRHHAIGLNYIDIYQRTGVYPNQLPFILGMEGSGIVEAVGKGVTHVKPGDRVAYAGNPVGAYTEARVKIGRASCRERV